MAGRLDGWLVGWLNGCTLTHPSMHFEWWGFKPEVVAIITKKTNHALTHERFFWMTSRFVIVQGIMCRLIFESETTYFESCRHGRRESSKNVIFMHSSFGGPSKSAATEDKEKYLKKNAFLANLPLFFFVFLRQHLSIGLVLLSCQRMQEEEVE